MGSRGNKRLATANKKDVITYARDLGILHDNGRDLDVHKFLRWAWELQQELSDLEASMAMLGTLEQELLKYNERITQLNKDENK